MMKSFEARIWLAFILSSGIVVTVGAMGKGVHENDVAIAADLAERTANETDLDEKLCRMRVNYRYEVDAIALARADKAVQVAGEACLKRKDKPEDTP